MRGLLGGEKITSIQLCHVLSNALTPFHASLSVEMVCRWCRKGGELSRPSSSSDLQVATGDLDSISSAASEESSELFGAFSICSHESQCGRPSASVCMTLGSFFFFSFFFVHGLRGSLCRGCGETPVAQAPGAGPTSGAGAFSQSTLALHQVCFSFSVSSVLENVS